MDEDTKAGLMKIGLAWIGGLAGMTLSQWVLLMTLVYTVLQTAFLLHDRYKRWRDGRK